MSMEGASFSSRRPAAGALPAMTLPPPTADVPSMAKYPFYPSFTGNSSESFQCSREGESVGYSYPPSYSPLPGPFPDRRISSSPSILTPSPGASDGLSPSLSSVNTGSSQGSQAPGNMYQYAQLPAAWATPSNSSYTVSSATQAQPALGQQHFPGRNHSIYNQGPGMHQYNHPRSSQSPATGGDGLPAPPYDQVHQPFQTAVSGGGGQTTPPGLSTSQQTQGAILTSQSSVATQPPTPSSASAHVDSYTHSRPPSTPNYYTSSASQPSSYPPYGHQPSPTQHSSSNGGPVPRGLGSISGQPHGAGMAPPGPYRSYAPYQTLPTMGGSVLSNIHQPGSQMSMIPGMPVTAYGHPMLYGGQGQPPPTQSERPFKCDQCVQSFSRNHDLKRHKRIHLAVKPFPCTYCSKSFSRKDALKRHRLVKGCESKANENPGDGNGADRSGEEKDSPEVKREQ
ncbi:hypothetical protein IWW34DRAFT_333792 [Fusarium oxysporum f. sp. albedinis]|nr:hypothetical protein IWW34DRAFT_333792 [Fusarium oxysporum f. sp. albedinis]KAJ0144445.1 hypothetical protein HZ326_12785 [Fusarium oxysporum f. sp. albedinis]KAK2477738.1 hypothetical protein H9L39_10226 [Fusarium oxysporum f. sp. albedinis]